MKKLSLLLAALMIFCCFALASCGEEETSSAPEASSVAPAVSSEAPAASSEKPEASSEEPAESSEEELPLVGEAEMFWVTHFNDGTSEGAGAIFTETDNAGGWWIHVAFVPVQVEDLENVYEIVEITNGIADGSATTVAVPEGGFVWAINRGNDYLSAGTGDTDFTSPNCDTALAAAQLWRVGDKMQFTGLDLEGLTIPTDTADVKWYDDAYVCTATWAPIND